MHWPQTPVRHGRCHLPAPSCPPPRSRRRPPEFRPPPATPSRRCAPLACGRRRGQSMQPRERGGPQQRRVLVRLVEEPGPAQEEPVPCQQPVSRIREGHGQAGPGLGKEPPKPRCRRAALADLQPLLTSEPLRKVGWPSRPSLPLSTREWYLTILALPVLMLVRHTLFPSRSKCRIVPNATRLFVCRSSQAHRRHVAVALPQFAHANF